jgi:hypothetical protein
MTFAIVTTLIIVLVASARYLTYALVGYLDYFLQEPRKFAALKKGVHGDAPIDFGNSYWPKTDSLAFCLSAPTSRPQAGVPDLKTTRLRGERRYSSASIVSSEASGSAVVRTVVQSSLSAGSLKSTSPS